MHRKKFGGTTIRSISDIAKNQRLKDYNKENVTPMDMISEPCADNQQLTRSLRVTLEVCDHHNDVPTASLIDVWIDETELESATANTTSREPSRLG